jgi:hypothetical protein
VEVRRRHRSEKALPHPFVSVARTALIVSGLEMAISLWIILGKPTQFEFLAGNCLPLAVLFLLRKRSLRNIKDGNDLPRLAAWVPTFCVAVAFIAYGVTFSVVQTHYFSGRSVAYRAELRKIDRAESKRTDAMRVATARVKAATNRLAHVTHAHSYLTAREYRELAVVGRLLKRANRNITRLEYLARKTSLSHKSLAGAILEGIVLLDQEFSMPRAPKVDELPPWFGKLGGFFTVATQLLAGLAVVLVFAQWTDSPTSETLFRSALPVTAVAVLCGLIGNLPDLSRSLQAVLLGPVIAGLAGALAALAIIASTSRPAVGKP